MIPAFLVSPAVGRIVQEVVVEPVLDSNLVDQLCAKAWRHHERRIESERNGHRAVGVEAVARNEIARHELGNADDGCRPLARVLVTEGAPGELVRGKELTKVLVLQVRDGGHHRNGDVDGQHVHEGAEPQVEPFAANEIVQSVRPSTPVLMAPPVLPPPRLGCRIRKDGKRFGRVLMPDVRDLRPSPGTRLEQMPVGRGGHQHVMVAPIQMGHLAHQVPDVPFHAARLSGRHPRDIDSNPHSRGKGRRQDRRRQIIRCVGAGADEPAACGRARRRQPGVLPDHPAAPPPGSPGAAPVREGCRSSPADG